MQYSHKWSTVLPKIVLAQDIDVQVAKIAQNIWPLSKLTDLRIRGRFNYYGFIFCKYTIRMYRQWTD